MTKERRPGLGLLDRLILLVAWITTCALVYMLGFYVGRGANGGRIGGEERVVRLPVTAPPPAEGQRAKSPNEFTFYDTLAAAERPAGGRGTAPPAVARPAVVPPAPAAAAAPSTTLPPRRVTTPPPTVPVAAAPAAGAPSPRPPSAAPAPVRPAVATAPTPPALGTPAPAAPVTGGWSVQGSPTRSREEAESLNQQLRTSGYDARIVRVLRNGETWYRVQVGRFANAEQAHELMRRLREREGLTHVFVGSE